jgi:hypothetical protein
MVTKEMLAERKATLEADMAAISGALQQIDWTLERMEEEIESSDILIEE